MDSTQRKPLRNITWDELQKHNTPSECWMAIRGKVYDVTSWLPKHPGGEDPVLLNAVTLGFHCEDDFIREGMQRFCSKAITQLKHEKY